MTNKEYIMKICNCSENDSINYKPYKYGREIKSITVNEAVGIIEQDIKEFRELEMLTDGQCIEAARDIFKNHIVVF